MDFRLYHLAKPDGYPTAVCTAFCDDSVHRPMGFPRCKYHRVQHIMAAETTGMSGSQRILSPEEVCPVCLKLFEEYLDNRLNMHARDFPKFAFPDDPTGGISFWLTGPTLDNFHKMEPL